MDDPPFGPFCYPPANIKASAQARALQQSDSGAHESFLDHRHDFIAADEKQPFRKEAAAYIAQHAHTSTEGGQDGTMLAILAIAPSDTTLEAVRRTSQTSDMT